MCPNINNEETRQLFNEIVTALGGSPLTLEEFRDGSLRSQRLGIDADAMDAAYAIWDINNGNPIDQTRDGSQSVLFETIMSNNGGDRNAAIKIKSTIYSKKWIELFGDTVEPSFNQLRDYMSGTSRPVIPIDGNYTLATNMFGFDNVSNLISDGVYFEMQSGEVLLNIKKDLPRSIRPLVDLISTLSVKVMPMYDMANWMTYDPVGLTIRINMNTIEEYSAEQNAMAMVHEVVHHYTIQSYRNPQTANEKRLKEVTDRLYNYYRNNIYNSDPSTFNGDLYGLTSPEEFIAEVMSNDSFKRLLETQTTSRMFRIKDALKRLFKAISDVFSSRRTFDRLRDKSGLEELIMASMLVILDNNQYGVKDYTIPTNLTENEMYNLDDFIYAINRQLNKNYTTDTTLILRMDELDRLHNDLRAGLDARMEALTKRDVPRRTSINELKDIIKTVSNNDAKASTIAFINHARSVMGDARRQIIKPLDQQPTDFLVRFKTDMEGFYVPMLRDIQNIVVNSDHFKDLPDYDSFVVLVNDMLGDFRAISSRFDYAILKRAVQIIKKMAVDNGSPTASIDHLLNNLNVTDEDISALAIWVGMSSNLGKSELIRLVNIQLLNQVNETKRNSLIKGNELKSKWNEVRKKYGNDAAKFMREMDSDGKYTGYFARPVRYGEQKRNFAQFLREVGEKFNLQTDEYGNYMLPEGYTPEEQQLIFDYNKEINDYLAQDVERKYKPEYYATMNRLTVAAQERLTEVNYQVQKIMDYVTDDDGIHLERLTPAQWESYKKAIRDKQALAIEYDIYGDDKAGDDLMVARNIREVNEEVYKNVNYQKNIQKFNEKAEEMKKTLSPAEYNTWYERNTVESLPEDLQEVLSNFERPAQSDEYDALYEKRRQLLRLVKQSDASKTDMRLVEPQMRTAIRDLDEQLSYLREPNEEGVKSEFSNYFTIVETAEYRAERNEALKQGTAFYEAWEAQNHYEDASGYVHPISIFTQIIPLNLEGLPDPSLLVRVPSQQWGEIDQSSEWFNPNFDMNSRETYQPKKSKYDNSKLWNELIRRPELYALYLDLLETMQESLDKIKFMSHGDIYKLPLINARVMNALATRGDLLKTLKWAAREKFEVREDDLDFVRDFKRLPNGDYLRHIPTRYMSMLDNPNLITSDTVASVISFFEMGENYKNMSAIKHDLLSIMYSLENKSYNDGRTKKVGKDLNEYKKLQHMLDTNLYGKRKDSLYLDIPGSNKRINLTKAMYSLTNLVRNRNLIGNLWSISAGYLTASINTKLDALLGRYFDRASYNQAVVEYARQFPKLTTGLSNQGQVNKLMALVQYNNIVFGNEEIFRNLDNSRVMRFLYNHGSYGGYTFGDFAVKSKILMSLYFNTKLVDTPTGKRFMRKIDFINEFYKDNKKRGEEMWKTNKEHLYGAYYVDKTNTLRAKPEYAQYIDKALENRMRNTANFIAARADGILSDLDRGKAHTNAITQFFTIHRGFIINGIHERFKRNQYNYMTGLHEEGLYRSTAGVVKKGFQNIFGNFDGMGKWAPQLGAMWSELEDYERYAVRKVAGDITNIMIWSMLLVPMIVKEADEDKDDWMMNAMAYIAMRTSFELGSLYKVGEFLAVLKSPSAAIDYVDDISNLFQIYRPSVWQDVKSGPYEGLPRYLRTIAKLTPIKNIIEATEPREKRKYLESQLMW